MRIKSNFHYNQPNMKPSHLAAMVIAGLGIGGMANAATLAQSNPGVSQSVSKSAIAIQNSGQYIKLQMQRGGMAYGEAPPSSWHKKNQRQKRLARRRSFAAGNRNAFSK